MNVHEIVKTLKLNINISETIFLIHNLMTFKLIEEEVNWSWQRFKFIFNINSEVSSLKAKKSSLLNKEELDEDSKPNRNTTKILKIIKSIS